MTIANDRSGTMAEHLLRQARQRRLLHNDLRTRAAQLLSIDHLASPNQTFTQLSAGDLHTCVSPRPGTQGAGMNTVADSRLLGRRGQRDGAGRSDGGHGSPLQIHGWIFSA